MAIVSTYSSPVERIGSSPLTWPQYIRRQAGGELEGYPQNYSSLLAGVNKTIQGYQSHLKPFSDPNNALMGLPGRMKAPEVPANEFSLVDVNRDPSGSFDSIRTNLLNRIAGASPNYSGIRDASRGILASIGAGGGTTGGGTTGAVGDLAPMSRQGRLDAFSAANAVEPGGESQVRAEADTFIDNLRRLQPNLQAENTTQSNALNRVFDPSGYQAELARNTQFAADAERRLANRAIQGALTQGRLGSAGGVGSSYVNAQIADATGRIGAETAARDADRRRQDTSALLAAQQQNFGRSQDLATRTLMLDQLPIEVRNNILDSEMRRTLQKDSLANTEVQRALGRMSALGQAVNIDQMTDELTTIGRQMGLSGQALQQFLASRIQGIRKSGDDYPLYIAGQPNRNNSPQSFTPNYMPPSNQGFVGGPTTSPGMGGGRQPYSDPRWQNPVMRDYFLNTGVWPNDDPYRSEYQIGQLNQQYFPTGAPTRTTPPYLGPGFGQNYDSRPFNELMKDPTVNEFIDEYAGGGSYRYNEDYNPYEDIGNY